MWGSKNGLRYRHSWWGGVPPELDFGGGEAVGGVDEVAELAFQGQGFGGESTGGGEGLGVLIAQRLQPRMGRQTVAHGVSRGSGPQ